SMADRSIVFAMANPVPEIDPAEAVRHAEVGATGRSDCANQINNVLAFPGAFRGLLDAQASAVSDQRLLAAAPARADVVPPAELNPTYVPPSVVHDAVATAAASAGEPAAREELGTVDPNPGAMPAVYADDLAVEN